MYVCMCISLSLYIYIYIDIRSHFGSSVAILVQALPIAKVSSVVCFSSMESSTDTYTYTHNVAVRGFSECSFIENSPIGARTWNALALFLMILSLLALALLAQKLAASMWKLGSHTCSNLGLEICKRLQNLIQPSLDEEVAELAKRRLLKLMDGVFRFIVIGTSVFTMSVSVQGMSVSMMRLEAEATEAFNIVATLGVSLPLLVPSMVFLQFPCTRTDRNINIWMAVIYTQHMIFLITPFWETDKQVRVSMINLFHVVFAFCSWRTSVVFWLNLAWALVAASSLERGNVDVVSPCGSVVALSNNRIAMAAFVVKLVIHLASRHMLLHEVRREVHAAKSLEEIFETLLNGMCDAVVQLDEDLNLKRRCPQLDVLLLRNSGSDCPPNFIDLLKTDDRARVRGSIQHAEVDTALGHVEEGHMANMMHADMLNAYGIPVHTSIQYTSYSDRDAMGNPCRMVGVREWSDWDETPGIFMCGNGLAESARAQRRQRLRDDCGSSHTGQSSTPSDASFMPLDTEHNDVSVWVQASAAMPMMKSTPGFFAHFGGPSLRHETSLTKWLSRTDTDAVFGQFQSFVTANVFLPTDQEHIRTLDVKLQHPHLGCQAFMNLSMFMQRRTTRAVASAVGAGADGDMDVASREREQQHQQHGSRDIDSEDRTRASTIGRTQPL